MFIPSLVNNSRTVVRCSTEYQKQNCIYSVRQYVPTLRGSSTTEPAGACWVVCRRQIMLKCGIAQYIHVKMQVDSTEWLARDSGPRSTYFAYWHACILGHHCSTFPSSLDLAQYTVYSIRRRRFSDEKTTWSWLNSSLYPCFFANWFAILVFWIDKNPNQLNWTAVRYRADCNLCPIRRKRTTLQIQILFTDLLNTKNQPHNATVLNTNSISRNSHPQWWWVVWALNGWEVDL